MSIGCSPWHRLTWTVIAGLQLSGCASYTTPIARDVTRGNLQIQVERATAVRHESAVRVGLLVHRVPPGVRLLGANLTNSGGIPCETGASARKLGRQGTLASAEPLRAGERIALEFDFGAIRSLAGSTPYLDLWLETQEREQRCVPIPLTDGTRALKWQVTRPGTLGADLSFEGLTDRLGPVSNVNTAALTLGLWLDEYHAAVGAGIVGAGCPEDACQRPSEDQRIDYSSGFFGYVGVERQLIEKGAFAFGGAVRYRVMQLGADTFEGRQDFWSHGPVIAPLFAVVDDIARENPDIGGAEGGLIGIELPVGYVFAGNGDRSFSIGGNLRLFLPVF
jgi:hypothetical protein